MSSGKAGFTGDCYELEGKRLFSPRNTCAFSHKCVGIRWHVMVCGVTGKPQQQQAMV
eukprot:COSAG01_NODE_1883_length_8988_cov_67.877264_5_plen_57_part_00